MRAVLTRVNSASVTIDGEVVGKIGKGFLILLGVGPNDTEKECRYLAEKALGLRIFTDEEDKMNLGLGATANPADHFLCPEAVRIQAVAHRQFQIGLAQHFQHLGVGALQIIAFKRKHTITPYTVASTR